MVRRPRRARRPDTRFPYTALFRSPDDLPAGTIQDRLLDAALACFRRLGGKRSRIGDIASEAGLARTAVYRYYPNKRASVAEIGRAPVCTLVTHAHLACRLLLEKNDSRMTTNNTVSTITLHRM